MKRFIAHRPSGSLIVAVLAVVLACAGSATAARLITGKQIRDGSITSSDVKDRSLLGRDFRRGQLPRGRVGQTGPAGRVGPAGRDGFGVLAYTGNSESVPAGDDTIVDTSCSPGTHPTGGSAYAVDSAGDPVDDVVKDDYLSLDGWQARAGNSTGGDVTVIVEAACANGTVVVNTARAATRRAR